MDIWNKITHLSRLKLTDKEQELLIPQVKKIIEFFNNISHIPTDSIQPLISPIEKNHSPSGGSSANRHFA